MSAMAVRVEKREQRRVEAERGETVEGRSGAERGARGATAEALGARDSAVRRGSETVALGLVKQGKPAKLELTAPRSAPSRGVAQVKSVQANELDIQKKEALLAQLGVRFEYSSLSRTWYPNGPGAMMAVERGGGSTYYENLTEPIKASTREVAIGRTFERLTRDRPRVENSNATYEVSWNGRGWTLHAGKLPKPPAPPRKVPAPRGVEPGAPLGARQKEAFLRQLGLTLAAYDGSFWMEGRLDKLEGMLALGYNFSNRAEPTRAAAVSRVFDELTAKRPVTPTLLGPGGGFLAQWDGRGWSLLRGELPTP
jgi:hypothetical protein